MDEREMRDRAAAARVARIGTVDEQGRVHIVPVVFALDGDTLYSTSDADTPLPKRLRNLDHDQRVTVLIDDYAEDWSNVWWVRLRGAGRVVDLGPERDRARGRLAEKYPQFGGDPGEGSVMAVDVTDWSAWAYSG